MKPQDRYSIGEVAETCNIPIKTLRYYDKIKLVVPKYRGDVSKYRYYSKDQMVTLCIIRRLRLLGFCLKEIQDIVLANKANDLQNNVEHKLVEIVDEIASLQQKYSEGCLFLQRLKTGVNLLSVKEEDSMGNVALEEVPKSHLLYTRQIMHNYSNTDVSLERWVEIIDLCETLKLKSKGAVIVTYYDNPLAEFLYEDADVEFGILVEEPGEGGTYRPYGGYLAATAVHIGDYADIVYTHIKLVKWINQNGYQVAGEISEEFIISPLDVNNIEEHVTKVIVPVEKADTKKKKK